MVQTNAFRLGAVDLPGIPLSIFDFPVVPGLIALHLCTDGIDLAALNFAAGNRGAIVGAPVASNGFVTFGAAGYLQTDADEVAEMTLFGAFRKPAAAGNAPFIGNYIGGPPEAIGVGLYATNGTSLAGNAGRTTATPTPSATATGSTTNWFFGSERINNVGLTTVRNFTTGTAANSSNSSARVVSPNGKIRVGKFYEANFTQNSDCMFAGVSTSALSDADLANIYAWAKLLAAEYAITL